MLFVNIALVMISDWAVVFAEGEVRWEWSFTFRERIGIVTLQRVEHVAVLINGSAFARTVVQVQEM